MKLEIEIQITFLPFPLRQVQWIRFFVRFSFLVFCRKSQREISKGRNETKNGSEEEELKTHPDGSTFE